MVAHKLHFFVIWMTIFSRVRCYVKIEAPNDKIKIEGTEDRYTLTMDENNHSFDGSTPLFKILDKTDCSSFGASMIDGRFTYKIENCIFSSMQSFDYETPNQRYYKISVLDTTVDATMIIININNIDDEPPVLTCPRCSFNESKIYDKSNTDCYYTLEDPDGWLGYMDLTVNAGVSNEDKTFTLALPDGIENDTYIVQVPMYNLIELDYKTINFFSFSVMAVDTGKNSATQSATVNVIDVRNTYPIWTYIFSFQQFEEKSHQEYDVSALDGDTGIGDKICYYKVNEEDQFGHEGDYVKIDEKTGHIDVNYIDRDEYDISMYTLKINACICNLKDWCTGQDISFYIEDIDDNSPLILYNNFTDGTESQEFNKDEEKIINVEFLENYAGSLNFSSFIKDIDTGENAEFKVELLRTEDFDYTVAYIIVPTAGYKNGNFRISVKNVTYLDFEDSNWKHNYFYVKSTGTYNESKTDHMYVNISLRNYNDEIPKFDKDAYEAEINETAKTGDFVVRANATDRDAEDKILTMEIIGTYAENRLQIDSDGNIVVNLTNPNGEDYYFDYDILNSVFFQVRAIDGVNHTSTVPVTLTIKDVNNKAPTIYPVDPVSVEEDQKDGAILDVSIKASDPDTTANLTTYIDWSTSYAIKNSMKINMNKTNQDAIHFLEAKITPESGEREISISLIVIDSDQKKPNYIIFDSLYLNLVVEDLNTDPDFMFNDRTSATILINIIDINNNPPYFPDDVNILNRTVQEMASKGTSVGFIQAIDPDIGDTVTYNCTATEEDWIVIDAYTGGFSVKNDNLVNADEPPRYYINYTCMANDGIHNSDALEVSFYIIDTNNKDPHLQINSTVSVVEKSKSNTEVVTMGTSDQDRDIPFHTVVCSFKSDDKYRDCIEQFLINENIIVVKNGGNGIDRDHGRTTFLCGLSCNDNNLNERSQGLRYVTQDVTIELLDINDHDPELITKEFEILENLKKGEEVGTIQASDIDYGENATIDFKIKSIINDDTKKDIISVFTITKVPEDYIVSDTVKMVHLVTKEDLRGYYGNYTINLELKDEGKPPRTADASLTKIKLTINKFNFEPPVILTPEHGTYLLLSSQDLGAPLNLFKKDDINGHLKNFKAEDGETKDCSKWDVSFQFAYLSDRKEDIFKMVKMEPCLAQLQINNNFNSLKVINEPYHLNITAWLNSTDVQPKDDENSYGTSIDIILILLDNSQEPHFDDNTSWEFDFVEADTTQKETLRNNATYDINNDLNIYYYLLAEEPTETYIDVNVDTGEISVLKTFFYDDFDKFQFQIVASNDTNPSSSNPMAYLNVTINVQSTNRRAPVFTSDSFFGAVMPTYKGGSSVTSITATDPDAVDKGKLTYTIFGEISKIGHGLDNIDDPPFDISTSDDVGKIYLQFSVESSMDGYFEFTVMVEDQQDKWGNGPHNATTKATIFIITTDNTVDFKFLNNVDEVQQRQKEMLDIVGKVLNCSVYIQNIDSKSEETFTIVRLYFIDSDTITLRTAEEILKIVANVNTFAKLAKELKDEQTLFLYSFPSQSSDVNTDAILRKWLLGVSIVLGVFCILLLAALIWKTKQLNRRISKLTTKKFGSQDSGLNRLGVSAPTTNKHAIEGSNPVYKNEDRKKPKDMSDFDSHSIRSGDSDLIGIENNPEFDYNFNEPSDKTTYL